MTAAVVSIPGVPITVSATPADTNEATLFTAGTKGATIVQMIVANVTSGALTATIQWNDATTDWDIYRAKSVAANDSLLFEPFIHLPASGAIKITSSSGNGLTFTATLVERLGAIGADHE